MGQVNNVLRRYLQEKERFADLFNGVFFQGDSVVQGIALDDASEVYTAPAGSDRDYIERVRDIKMKLKTGESLCLLAVENQNQVDYTMPFRCMQYDVMEYGQQIEQIKQRNKRVNDYDSYAEKICGVKRTDYLMPVYTLCFYHGEETWDGPRALKDMMDFGDMGADLESIMRKAFVDYPFHLYCLNENSDFSMFQTELKQLFQMLKCRKDKKELKKLVCDNDEYRHISEDTLEVASVMLNQSGLWKNRKNYKLLNEEEYDMCQAMREWAEEERSIGLEQGLEQGVCRSLGNIMKNMQLTLEQAMNVLEVSGVERDKYTKLMNSYK